MDQENYFIPLQPEEVEKQMKELRTRIAELEEKNKELTQTLLETEKEKEELEEKFSEKEKEKEKEKKVHFEEKKKMDIVVISEDEVEDDEDDDTETFPNALGPFGIIPTNLRPKIESMESFIYSISFLGKLGLLHKFNVWNFGTFSPKHPITLDEKSKIIAKIPIKATSFVWAYPLAGVSQLTEDQKAQLDLTAPEVVFVSFGGYLYFDSSDRVVGANAIGIGRGLFFNGPHKWDHEFTSCLYREGRFQDITIQSMYDKGARYYCWVRPNETLVSESKKEWKICENGGFVYLFHQNPFEEDPRDCFFCVGNADPNEEKKTKNVEHEIFAFSSFAIAPKKKIQNAQKEMVTSKKIEELESITHCVVCMENLRKCMFIPCAHLSVCEECAKSLTNCPICRAKIQKVVNVFL
ncbi:caspase regulator ring finger domain-containing [Anaeramoeba ignava]|uniref:Caspase regulator ring finger domain-containing n=1 Tax=Anaeramoeba ignava TaxID=1746090 RepID=A0A9Q0LJ88_ANAIG|nr:caspase regulator ring finger domain-containing [Anaeramoeba ignava]